MKSSQKQNNKPCEFHPSFFLPDNSSFPDSFSNMVNKYILRRLDKTLDHYIELNHFDMLALEKNVKFVVKFKHFIFKN